MEISDEQLLEALKRIAEEERQHAKECPPLTDAQFQQLMGTLRSAVQSKEPVKRNASVWEAVSHWFSEHLPRPVVWAPIAALVLALLIAGPLLWPGSEQWRLTVSTASIKAPAADHPLRTIALGNWIAIPSFTASNIVLKAIDGSSFSGALTPAPELNLFKEKDRRFYRLTVRGQSQRGLPIEGTGRLELKGAVLATTSAPAIPKLRDLDWARLMVSLQTSNFPPVETVQELLKGAGR